MAQLAGRDHGVLDVAELLRCGLTRSGIQRRAQGGRLHRLHQGVYAVGHAAISKEGRWLAAVKAAGPGAVLSHQTAAQVWDLLPRCADPIHVTVPGARRPRLHGTVVVHRSTTLTDRDVSRRDRIPVTTPARTLADLKRALPLEPWEAALDRARSRGFSVADVVDEAPTRSALERKFIRLCRRHRIPAPSVNVLVGPFLVDFLWPDSRFIVEVDGYKFHASRASFESDRARDAELAVRGYHVVRFTYRQLDQQPAECAGTLRRLLRQ